MATATTARCGREAEAKKKRRGEACLLVRPAPCHPHIFPFPTPPHHSTDTSTLEGQTTSTPCNLSPGTVRSPTAHVCVHERVSVSHAPPPERGKEEALATWLDLSQRQQASPSPSASPSFSAYATYLKLNRIPRHLSGDPLTTTAAAAAAAAYLYKIQVRETSGPRTRTTRGEGSGQERARERHSDSQLLVERASFPCPLWLSCSLPLCHVFCLPRTPSHDVIRPSTELEVVFGR